jgi:hypothetical protein
MLSQADDNERLAARYHDGVDWLSHAPVSLIPIRWRPARQGGGIQGVCLALPAFQRHQTRRCNDHSGRECGATLSEVQMLQSATGRIIHSRIASFHRFQNEKSDQIPQLHR